MDSNASKAERIPLSVATAGGTSALERWAKFFGPPNFPMNPNPYDKYSVETYDLPEAYKGRNLFLRERIDELIRKGNDWYTSVALPWKSTNDIHVQWNEWHFTSTLAGRVPHEGISRLVSSSKRTFRDHVVRRGLALILEHGFMSTPEGEEQYIRSLLGIRQCVQETCNYDVIYAYLTCKNYEREWEAKYGIRNPEIVRAALDREVARFAAVQKSEDGLDILHEELKSQLLQRGITPDTWIFPPRMMMYITMVPPKNTEYYRGGEKAVERFEKGPQARASFRGCDVYETRPFEVHENEPPVDLLVRPQQVGEYYRMLGTDFVVEPKLFKTEHRDIVIYDEGNDNWARVSFRSALVATLANIRSAFSDPNAKTPAVNGVPLSKKSATIGALLGSDQASRAELMKYFPVDYTKATTDSAGNVTYKTDKLSFDAYLRENVNFDVDPESNLLVEFATQNIPVPFGILLFRPFITHYASSAILTVAGSSTGSTFVGHSDFQLGDDVASKLHYGNFTFYSKSIVTNPKQVIVAENIFLQGYIGGNDATFLTPEGLREYIQNGTFQGSIIPTFVPYVAQKISKVYDLRKNDDDLRPAGRERITGIDDIAGLYDLKGTIGDTREWNVDSLDAFFNSSLRYNSVCFQGHQMMYRQKVGDVGDWDAVIVNTGHHGPDVYPGCGKVRRGQMKFLQQQGYNQSNYAQRALNVV